MITHNGTHRSLSLSGGGKEGEERRGEGGREKGLKSQLGPNTGWRAERVPYQVDSTDDFRNNVQISHLFQQNIWKGVPGNVALLICKKSVLNFIIITTTMFMWFNGRVLYDICVWAGRLVADVLILLQPPHWLAPLSTQILCSRWEINRCWSRSSISLSRLTNLSFHLSSFLSPSYTSVAILIITFRSEIVLCFSLYGNVEQKNHGGDGDDEIWPTIGSRFVVNNSSESKQLSRAAPDCVDTNSRYTANTGETLEKK